MGAAAVVFNVHLGGVFAASASAIGVGSNLKEKSDRIALVCGCSIAEYRDTAALVAISNLL